MSLRRRTSRIPQLLFAASLLGVLVAPPAAATTARPPSGGDLPLRVATYNIHAGAGVDGVFDLDRQTAELRSLDADVIGLQEVDRHWATAATGRISPESWRGGCACTSPSRRSTAWIRTGRVAPGRSTG